MRTISLIFLSLLNSCLVFAQIKKDSLNKVINATNAADTSKVSAALVLGKIYLSEQDSAKCADNFFNALSIAKRANYPKGIIDATTQIGYLNELTQNQDKALRYYSEAIHNGKQHDLLAETALAYSYKFFIYSARSNYKTAIPYADSAYVIFQKLNRYVDMGNQLNNIGLMHNKLNLNKEAINYYQRALKLYDRAGPVAEAKKTNTILNIGLVFETLKSHNQALKYYQEGLGIAVKNRYTKTIVDANNNIGNVYFNTKNFKKAYQYYYNNLGPSQKLNDPVAYAIALGNVANVLTDLKDKSAEKYYQLAFEQYKISGNLEGLISNYINYARFLGESGQLKLADNYLQKAMILADKNNMAVHKQAIYESMAEIKKREKDFEHAYALQDSALRLKETILNPSTNKEIAKLTIQYQTERKEKEIAKNKAVIAQNKLDMQKRDNQLYIAVIALLLLSSIGLYVVSATKSKQKRLIQQHDFNIKLAGAEARNKLQEERLRISRELHDNIGSQLTFINAAMQNMDGDRADPDAIAHTQLVTQNTIADLRRTVWLINQEEVDLDEFVIKLRDYVKPLQYNNPQFKIVVEYGGNCTLQSFIATHLFRIIQEGLNNAVKYAQASLMNVTIAYSGNMLSVEIKDNGKGFDPKVVTEGYGLKNINARSHELNGQCTISSSASIGTTININVPV